MMHTFPLLAAAEVFDRQVKEATQSGRFDTRDALMAISISVAVGVLLFAWAYFRYRKKEGVEQRASEPRKEHDRDDAGENADESGRRRRRKRRRKRDHRPRNPSLQQTGGLPPPRPDDQLPKF